MDFYCKIFIQTSVSKRAIADKITQWFNWTFDSHFSVENDCLVLDLRKNKEASERVCADFLYFPYFLDVDIPKEASVEKYKEMIARLFCCLRDEGWQVVIACGFEEELPGNGRSLYNKK